MANLKHPRSFLGTAALLYGVGTASTPYTWGAANKNALGFWVKSNATSGDARAIYARLYLGGAGGGEAIRAFATATTTSVATGGTMNGIHATAYINTSSSISGQAAAGRFTLGAAAAARTLGGTLSSLIVDSDIGASNTLPTPHAFVRFTDVGTVKVKNLFQVPDPTTGGALFATHSSTAVATTHSLKIIGADGTAYYIQCTTTATGRAT